MGNSALSAQDAQKIREVILNKTQAAVEASCGEGGERLIKELENIAFSDYFDFVDPVTGQLKDPSLMPPGASRQIKNIVLRTVWEDGLPIRREVVALELYPKLTAMRELSAIGGYRAAERHEITGKNGEPVAVNVEVEFVRPRGAKDGNRS